MSLAGEDVRDGFWDAELGEVLVRGMTDEADGVAARRPTVERRLRRIVRMFGFFGE